MEPASGHDPEAVVERSAFDHVHPTDARRLARVFEEGVETGRQADQAVFRYRDADGGWRWLESVGANLLEAPRVEAVVIDSRDVTGLAAPHLGPRERTTRPRRARSASSSRRRERGHRRHPGRRRGGRAVPGRPAGVAVRSLTPDRCLDAAGTDGPLTLLVGNGAG